MQTYQRAVGYLAAVVVAFGGLFFSRLLIYPVAVAQGNFLQRLVGLVRGVEPDRGHAVTTSSSKRAGGFGRGSCTGSSSPGELASGFART